MGGRGDSSHSEGFLESISSLVWLIMLLLPTSCYPLTKMIMEMHPDS